MALTYNIKSDGGAVGDGTLTTAVLTISNGSAILQSSTPLWSAGDVNKGITVDGAGDFGLSLYTTISAFTSSTQITLAHAAGTALSAVSCKVVWGSDDSPAFVSFNTAGRAASGLVTLNIPAGVYYLNSNDANDLHWCRGIPNLKVVGAGLPILTGNFNLGTFTHPTTNQCSARIASVSAGATSLQLLTVADYTKFQAGRQITQSDGIVYTAGTTCLITGIDMQGFGDPNPFYFEWATITNVNSLTGVITLSSPIRNSYLQTWPLFNAGATSGPNATDNGGPATIYMLDASWDATIEINGIQMFSPGAQINSPVRTISYTNGSKWISNNLGLGPNPSNNETFTMDAADFTGCFVEVDKVVGTLNILNGTVGGTIWFQSASTDDFIIDSSTIEIQGTPKRTSITSSVIADLQLGAEGYGRTDSLSAVNSTISAISAIGVTDTSVNTSGDFTCTAALIAGTAGPIRWGVPGTHIILKGPQENEAPMTLGALTGDGSPTVAASNAYLATSHPGPSWPVVPLQGGTRLDLMAHPCPVLSLRNCIGCADAIDLSQVGAQGKPIYSYTKRTYTAADLINPIAGPSIWGHIRSVRVTVNVAFTTVGALNLKLFGQFQVKAVGPDGVASTWGNGSGMAVDLKTAGVRTITYAAVTGSVGADSLTAPGNIWFSGQQTPYISGTITGGDPGSVTIEVQTNQGFGMLVPNLRFHS